MYAFINKVKIKKQKIVAGLVRAFGNEWGSKGVCVNGIAPGYIATNNMQALREDEDRSKSIPDRIPVGRWSIPQILKGL